jgi:hypothetical protein
LKRRVSIGLMRLWYSRGRDRLQAVFAVAGLQHANTRRGRKLPMLTCSTAAASPVDGRKPADGKALAGFLYNLPRGFQAPRHLRSIRAGTAAGADAGTRVGRRLFLSRRKGPSARNASADMTVAAPNRSIAAPLRADRYLFHELRVLFERRRPSAYPRCVAAPGVPPPTFPVRVSQRRHRARGRSARTA